MRSANWHIVCQKCDERWVGKWDERSKHTCSENSNKMTPRKKDMAAYSVDSWNYDGNRELKTIGWIAAGVVKDSSGMPIADVRKPEHLPLISSAPALLAACKKIHSDLMEMSGSEGGELNLDYLVKAIAKAEKKC